jgi:hypothetical protein
MFLSRCPRRLLEQLSGVPPLGHPHQVRSRHPGRQSGVSGGQDAYPLTLCLFTSWGFQASRTGHDERVGPASVLTAPAVTAAGQSRRLPMRLLSSELNNQIEFGIAVRPGARRRPHLRMPRASLAVHPMPVPRLAQTQAKSHPIPALPGQYNYCPLSIRSRQQNRPPQHRQHDAAAT